MKKYYILTLLISILFLQSAIPAGFMPGHNDNGSTIEICTSYGIKKIDQKSPASPPQNDYSEECPFSIFNTYYFDETQNTNRILSLYDTHSFYFHDLYKTTNRYSFYRSQAPPKIS